MNPALLHNDGIGLTATISRKYQEVPCRIPCSPSGWKVDRGSLIFRRGSWLRCNHENRLHPFFPLQDWGRWLFCLRYLGARAALVAGCATTKLDNRTDDLYLLYPQTKQFRANFTKGNFLTVGFPTMTKAFFRFYTLYAIRYFLWLPEKLTPCVRLSKFTE